MSTIEAMPTHEETGAIIAAATAGDQEAFSSLTERYRPELQLHCYRMLGSYEESEDVVQETLLRAWRKRSTYAGRSSFRAWLYRIATNASLDALAKDPRRPRRASASAQAAPARPTSTPTADDVPWIQACPDRLLESIPAGTEDQPHAAVVSKETIELAYMVAIQHLPPRQRAVLILRDILSWSAKDTAEALGTSVASANSALQRARATLKQHLPEQRNEWGVGTQPTPEERALLDRYIEATEDFDADAFVAMLREDATFTMPPQPGVWVGGRAIVDSWIEGGFGQPDWGRLRAIVTRANMQPAIANYVRKPGGDVYRPMALDVLTIAEGRIAEIVTFPFTDPAAYGLPETLDPDEG
jgi:RNA polymerase sigma-70 factor (ECF subfamily)